ncbi:MAG: HPr(Ser) kinase/phosphatase [Atopostipes suicloacalis]|nr:HPr(Ser) kinase/phosphatase [Atopostipes suicloacalis]
MASNSVTVNELTKALPYIDFVSGEEFGEREIEVIDLSRPAVEMTGYFDFYPKERIQLFGATEVSFINRLTLENRQAILERMCTPETPAFLISRGQETPEGLEEIATKARIPVLTSGRSTTRLSANLMNFLEERLSERMDQHGVFMDIYGMGVLIIGDSGIGKSETGLELVQRGHRLVADDRVELYMMDESRIIGEPPYILRHMIEIRGLGVIDIMNMFGVGSVRDRQELELVINLRRWEEDYSYDRLGNDVENKRFFNVEVPMINIPVKVGRNLATIVEVAAMNMRAKEMGYDATATFEERLTELIESNTKNLEDGKK